MGTVSTDSQDCDDRVKELKAFDETKRGVKGLVDSGVSRVPKMFVRPPEELSGERNTPRVELRVPVVDLAGIEQREGGRHDEAVRQVMGASERWGFFQVVNHGVPVEVMEGMMEGVRMFHEQEDEAKEALYSRDQTKQVLYNSNYDLYKSRAANWRDTLTVKAVLSPLHPEALPQICRDVMLAYINHALKLGETLLELLSVGLGLRPGRLSETSCIKGWTLVNHYYPACPEPELTLGTSRHTDPSFFTLLLQDQLGGLQVLHQDRWVDIHPIRGAFVVNIGDILQLISNDKLKSVYHRVTANRVGPRVSVALFLSGVSSSPQVFGPIQELLSEDKPAVYREFTLAEFFTHFFSRPLVEPGTEYFKVRNDGDNNM